jgi:hypothetical protein
MSIINLYSKRKAASERLSGDVFSYDDVPTTLRTQLKQMIDEGYDNYEQARRRDTYFAINIDTFETTVKMLRREYGVDKLTDYSRGERHELLSFLEICETEQFLDCAELYGKLVNESNLNSYRKLEVLYELNYRFREAGLGYEFLDNIIIRKDTEVLHNEVLKPTLNMLGSNVIFAGAEHEIQESFIKYRHKDNKAAVMEAAKSFESVMKAILQKNDHTYSENDSASKLVDACIANEIIPKYLETHFKALSTLLKTGLPVLRNKTSGHGQGASIKNLDDHFVSYALYTALANIKLIIECDKKLQNE